MSDSIKPANLAFSAEVSVLVFCVWSPFWLSWPVRSAPHPQSQADLLSRSPQFLCGLIRLIRTCASFQGTQALGVVEGTEASSQDLSTPYPAAGKTSQGQPGGLLWEGCQQLQSASSFPPASTYTYIILIRLTAQLTGPIQAKQKTFGEIKMANLKLLVQ